MAEGVTAVLPLEEGETEGLEIEAMNEGKIIDLANSPCPMEALQSMQDELKSAWSLSLYESDITGPELASIAPHFSNLRHLHVDGTVVGDVGITAVAQYAKLLEFLSVSDCQISDAGLVAIARGLTNLTDVYLDRNELSDEGMMEAARYFRTLGFLDVSNTGLSSASLLDLAKQNTDLHDLDVSQCMVDDQFVDGISGFLVKLEWLALDETHVTDASLEVIGAHFPLLDGLFVQRTQVTADGVIKLKETRPDLKVFLDGEEGVGDE